MAATPKAILTHWEDLKQIRAQHEAMWRDKSDYFMPRRNPVIVRGPGELRDRRVVDAIGMIQADRLTAMVFGWLISPAMPFIRPDIGPGLIAAGRAADDIDEAGRDYLDGINWGLHSHLMSAESGFAVAMHETLGDWSVIGTGVLWTGRKRGFGARYQSRPIWNCWIAANDNDEIDTLYYAFTLPAHRVIARWPQAADLESVKNAAKLSENASVKLLLAVEPREGGRPGAMAKGKPFQSVVLLVDDKVVLEESGYDSFPYAVPRFAVRPGEVYGYSQADIALPDVKLANVILEAIIDGAEQAVRPPAIAPMRMFPKAIDRRAGAVNYYQASQMGLQNADQAVRAMVAQGDIGLGVELLREIRRQVEFTFYTDWMRLRESGNMTATEVNDRRDMRLRGMTPIVSRAERDLMGPIADRTFEINDQERWFGDPPDSVRGLEIRWGYTGPMALAQLQAQREAVGATLMVAKEVAQYDQAAAMVADGEELIRIAAESAGLPPAGLKSRQAMAEIRAAQEQAQARAAEAENDAKEAAALRDGGQAVASLVGAMSQPQPERMAA